MGLRKVEMRALDKVLSGSTRQMLVNKPNTVFERVPCCLVDGGRAILSGLSVKWLSGLRYVTQDQYYCVMGWIMAFCIVGGGVPLFQPLRTQHEPLCSRCARFSGKS